jgi:hypothetical protein
MVFAIVYSRAGKVKGGTVGRHLTYYGIGGLVALGGVWAIVQHFRAPGSMPDIGPFPFWICLGVVLILGGAWFGLKGQMASLADEEQRLREKKTNRRKRPDKHQRPGIKDQETKKED